MARQINLYDPALRKKRDWLALSNVMIGAVALLIGVVAAGLPKGSLHDWHGSVSRY